MLTEFAVDWDAPRWFASGDGEHSVAHLAGQLCAIAGRTGANAIYVSATPSESAVGFYRSQGFALADPPVPELADLEPEGIHMVKRFPHD